VANAIEMQLLLNDQMTAGLSRASNAVSAFTQSLGGVTLGMTGVAGAAIALTTAAVAMGQRISGQAEQLDNLSASTGVSTQRLQALQFAFRQGGVDVQSLAQGLGFMSRALEGNADQLRKLGVTSRDPFQAFRQLATVIASTDDIAKRNALTFQVFGRGGLQLIPILKQIATGYDGIQGSAAKAGVIWSDAELKRMADLDKVADGLSATFEGFGSRLAALAAGPLTTFLQMLTQILDKLEKMKGAASSAADNSASGALGFAKVLLEGLRLAGVPGIAQDGTSFKPGIMLGPTPTQEELDRANGRTHTPPTPPWIDVSGMQWFPRLSDQDRNSPGRGLHIVKMMDEIKIQLPEAVKAFQKFTEEVAHSFDIIGQHVYSGFFTVLSQLTTRTQTFASAMKTIWRSIVDGILAAMADLIASAITKAFLKLLGAALASVTGNLGFIFGASGAIDTLSGNVTAGSVPGAGVASLGAGGNTYVIQTFDAKSTLSELVNPTGSFRKANDRMFEIGAVA
jgi:hypothetical protein